MYQGLSQVISPKQKNMKKKIQEIYNKAVDWLRGDNSISIHDLIEECADAIKDIPELNELCEELMIHINMWGVDTLEEQYERAGILAEEITGYLGQWLVEN